MRSDRERVWTLAEPGRPVAPGLRREIIGRQDTVTLTAWRMQAAMLIAEIRDVLDGRRS